MLLEKVSCYYGNSSSKEKCLSENSSTVCHMSQASKNDTYKPPYLRVYLKNGLIHFKMTYKVDT